MTPPGHSQRNLRLVWKAHFWCGHCPCSNPGSATVNFEQKSEALTDRAFSILSYKMGFPALTIHGSTRGP